MTAAKPKCDVCRKVLPPYAGRGRPPLRHPECQVEHRRAYLTAKKREQRKKSRI